MVRKSLKVLAILMEVYIMVWAVLRAASVIRGEDFPLLTNKQLTSEGMITMAHIVIGILVSVALVFLYCTKGWKFIKQTRQNAHEVQKEREALQAILRKVS